MPVAIKTFLWENNVVHIFFDNDCLDRHKTERLEEWADIILSRDAHIYKTNTLERRQTSRKFNTEGWRDDSVVRSSCCLHASMIPVPDYPHEYEFHTWCTYIHKWRQNTHIHKIR